MEIMKYDLTTFDALWKQYASLSVEAGLYDKITYLRAELEGAIVFTFPLKMLEQEYRIPHFTVFALTIERRQATDEGVVEAYDQVLTVREFNAEVDPDGDPVKELRIIGVPFDFDGKIWLDQVNYYLDSLEHARRVAEIDAIDD